MGLNSKALYFKTALTEENGKSEVGAQTHFAGLNISNLQCEEIKIYFKIISSLEKL
jgi:hypothetical protein